MRKSIAILAVIAFATVGIHSQSLAGFQTAFQSLAGDIAASLATDSTVGSDWSDAYVGGFPSFGAGLATGATFVNVASASTLFAAMGAAMPSAFSKYGIPIPAAVATLKIGIPFLPLDIGVTGGYIPPSIGKTLLCDTGINANYQNIGIQIRYALVKQNMLLPNVSIGVAYDYQQGNLSAPTGIGAQSLSYGSYSVTMSNPNLDLGWTSSTFDFTAQVSKKLLFLVPYIGAGYTVGRSTVTGGLDSKSAPIIRRESTASPITHPANKQAISSKTMIVSWDENCRWSPAFGYSPRGTAKDSRSNERRRLYAFGDTGSFRDGAFGYMRCMESLPGRRGSRAEDGPKGPPARGATASKHRPREEGAAEDHRSLT